MSEINKKHADGFFYGEKNGTLLLCAWCGWKTKDEKKIFAAKEKMEKEHGGASHGICEECSKNPDYD